MIFWITESPYNKKREHQKKANAVCVNYRAEITGGIIGIIADAKSAPSFKRVWLLYRHEYNSYTLHSFVKLVRTKVENLSRMIRFYIPYLSFR